MKEPGSTACKTMNTYAKPQATSVNVAPTANSSSRVITWSASMYADQAVCGVEVQDRLERGRVRAQGIVA